jgi:hypothetical protein
VILKLNLLHLHHLLFRLLNLELDLVFLQLLLLHHLLNFLLPHLHHRFLVVG